MLELASFQYSKMFNPDDQLWLRDISVQLLRQQYTLTFYLH